MCSPENRIICINAHCIAFPGNVFKCRQFFSNKTKCLPSFSMFLQTHGKQKKPICAEKNILNFSTSSPWETIILLAEKSFLNFSTSTSFPWETIILLAEKSFLNFSTSSPWETIILLAEKSFLNCSFSFLWETIILLVEKVFLTFPLIFLEKQLFSLQE